MVAFAKSGPLLRLQADIERWRGQRKTIEAIFGIDNIITSRQALEFALRHFNKTYISYAPGSTIFHPKFYLFSGDQHAMCFYGSHNLTVGGTETNFEGGVKIDFDMQRDQNEYGEVLACWDSMLPLACPITLPLDAKLMNELLRQGLIPDEAAMPPKVVIVRPLGGAQPSPPGMPGPFAPFRPMPPSAIPAGLISVSRRAKRTAIAARATRSTISPPVAVSGLVIQIVPHHNGEVFLSKQAVNQNPVFFGFPFTGKTKPKKSTNAAYPQRVPDPVVNISVYDKNDKQTLRKLGYGLNTVYYDTKAEIRVTFSPDILQHVPQHSIMVMSKDPNGQVDYNVEIFSPGSTSFKRYEAVCNQVLPSGGSSTPRKMGWI